MFKLWTWFLMHPQYERIITLSCQQWNFFSLSLVLLNLHYDRFIIWRPLQIQTNCSFHQVKLVPSKRCNFIKSWFNIFKVVPSSTPCLVEILSKIVGDFTKSKSNNKRTKWTHQVNRNQWLTWRHNWILSLDNICPHTQVAKGFLQTCPQESTKFIGFYK